MARLSSERQPEIVDISGEQVPDGEPEVVDISGEQNPGGRQLPEAEVTRRIAVKEIDLTGLGVVDVSGEQDPDGRRLTEAEVEEIDGAGTVRKGCSCDTVFSGCGWVCTFSCLGRRKDPGATAREVQPITFCHGS